MKEGDRGEKWINFKLVFFLAIQNEFWHWYNILVQPEISTSLFMDLETLCLE